MTVTGGGFGPWVLSTTTNMTFSALSSTITFTGNSMGMQNATRQLRLMAPCLLVVEICKFREVGSLNITVTGTATKTCIFNRLNAWTITGTLTLAGNSATNRLLFNNASQI